MRVAGPLLRAILKQRVALHVPELPWFPVLLGLYLLLVSGVRCLLARSLMFDESEEFALSQVLALGYGAQPPLIVWIVWAAVACFGPSAAVVVGVRLAVLGLLYAGLYACGRVLTQRPDRAALAAASALLIPTVGWDFVTDKMHTPLTCAVAAFTVAALVRAVRGGELRWAVAVGMIVGLGPLCKYTYLPFAAGLLAAACTLPAYRRWVFSSRGLVAVFVALLVVLPHAVWVIENRVSLTSAITRTMTDRPANSRWSVLLGAANAVFLGCGLFVAVFAVAVPGGFRRNSALPAEARLLTRALLIGGLLSLAIVVANGGNRFKAHWFTPLMVLVPAVLVARMDCVAVSPRRVALIWVACCAVVIASVAGGIVLGKTDWLKNGRSLRYQDRLIAETATVLTDEHPETIVCEGVRHAGNLRLAFPSASVSVLGLPAGSRPTVRGTRVVLVWEAEDGDAIPNDVLSAIELDYGMQPDPLSAVRFTGGAPAYENPHGRRLGMVRLVR